MVEAQNFRRHTVPHSTVLYIHPLPISFGSGTRERIAQANPDDVTIFFFWELMLIVHRNVSTGHVSPYYKVDLCNKEEVRAKKKIKVIP